MALDSKNNIKSVFIVPSVTPEPAAGTKITPGSTTPNWVGITNMSNEVLTTGSGSGAPFGIQNYSKIKIIKDRGADLPLQQVVLNLSDIANTSAYSGAIASEQSSYIGYDGTSGTIASTALDPNTFYEVKLEHVPNQFAYGKRPANYKYGTWQSGATAPTEIEVVTNIVKSLIQNFVPNRTTDWRVKSEVIASGAGVLVATSLDVNIVSITFNKYSKTAVVTTNGAVSAIAANTYIRVGGTTTTNPIVKVVSSGSVAGAGTFNIVLDYAWQGDSGAVLAADLYTVATLGNVGIKITGIKQKYDVNRWRQYDKVRFNPFVNSAFTSTPVSTVAAFDGVAVYEQAANDEYISWGDEGQIFVDQVPPLFREQDAVVGTQYNPVVISWLNRLPSLIGAGENKGQIILYMAGGDGIGTFTPATNQATFVTVFNDWVSTNLELITPFLDPTV